MEKDAKIKNPKLQSPLPWIIKFRNLIFGKKSPSFYTKLTFFINLFGTLVFGLWCVLSYFSIAFKGLFLEYKGVNVVELISKRGVELGFTGKEFLEIVTTLYGLSMISWGVVFVSLILLWRMKKMFAYLFFGGVLFYIGMNIFYVSFSFFIEDTTFFDKVLLLIICLNTIFYLFLSGSEEEVLFD